MADLALGELLDDGGTTLIEWGDAVATALPADYLEVRLTFGDGDDDRLCSCAPWDRSGRLAGTPWPERSKASRAEPWRRVAGECSSRDMEDRRC